MGSNTDIKLLELQFNRYLALGSEKAFYATDRSGTRLRPKALNAISELVDLNLDRKQVCDIITGAAAQPHVDTSLLAYMLALCIKCGNENVRGGAYNSIPTVCKSSKVLFLCFKYIREMGNQQKSKGWGSGCKKAVTKWYIARGKSLVETLIREKRYYGFCHKDLLLLAHFKAPTKQIETIINHFALNKENVALPEDLQKLSSDLKELNTTEDALKAAYLMSELKLDPSYLPHRFHRSSEMWTDYVKALPIVELLHKLEYFSSSRKLTAVLPVVTAILNDCDGAGLDPAEIYGALRKYELCYNFLRKDKAVALRRAAAAAEAAATASDSKPKGQVKTVGPKADPVVVKAVENLLNKCMNKLPSSKTSWAIGLDLREGGNAPVSNLPYVLGAGATALTLQWLVRVGSETSVVAVGNVEIKPDKDATVLDMTAKLKQLRSHPNTFSQVIKNAIAEKKQIDAFVIVSDTKAGYVTALTDGIESLKEYRNLLGRPKTRLILLFLKCHRELTFPNDPDILIVTGFDERVPRLIEAFGNGLL